MGGVVSKHRLTGHCWRARWDTTLWPACKLEAQANSPMTRSESSLLRPMQRSCSTARKHPPSQAAVRAELT